jgi:GPH family glycoside/pentoside/hexuronide:cation symporter
VGFGVGLRRRSGAAPETQCVTVAEKIGYAVGDSAANFLWRAVVVFLPFFLTDAAGIGPAAVGVLLLVCRVWDGAADLAMGVVADRTHTRWGKFRPWILWSAVPLAVCGVLTFSAPELGTTGRLAYAYVTYGALVVCYTMNNVPYNALMGVMSSSPVERSVVSSYRFFFAFLGGLLLQGLMLPLLSALHDPRAAYARAASAWDAGGAPSLLEGAFYRVLGHIASLLDTRFFHALYGDGPAFRYTAAMTFFSGLALILFVVTFATTRERVHPPVEQRSNVTQDASDLLRNRPWLVLFGVGILFVTFTTLKSGAILYYFTYYVGNAALAGPFMVVGLLGAMTGSAATGALVRLVGKRRLMLYSLGLGITSSALLYVARPSDVGLMFTLSTLTELSTGPIVTLFFAMLADAADYSEWCNHRRATGLFYSAGTVAMKVGAGMGGALTGLLLAAFGYIATSGTTVAHQPATALQGMRLLISILPAAVALLMLVTFLFYTLDEPRLAQIEADLAVRQLPPRPAAARIELERR